MNNKIIEIKNEDCAYDNQILYCEDSEVYAIYIKNNKWNLYGSFYLNNQKDYNILIDEIVGEEGVYKADIKLVKPISTKFMEVNFDLLQNNKLKKQKAAAAKKIADLKKKFNL